MSANDLTAARDAGRPAGSALRRPTAWLAALGVVVLLAAAFALSYDGFVALARAGGVSDRLAPYYPVVYDAMMVVAFAAIFVLRTARVYVRLLTWLSAIFILALCAAAGAVHAAGVHIPRQPLAAGVATTPFLLLVLAFRLWLTMLRHIRRGTARRGPGRERAEYAEAEYAHPDYPTGPLALPSATIPAPDPHLAEPPAAQRPAEEAEASRGAASGGGSPENADAGRDTSAIDMAGAGAAAAGAAGVGMTGGRAPGADAAEGAAAEETGDGVGGEVYEPAAVSSGEPEGADLGDPVARGEAVDAGESEHDRFLAELDETPDFGELAEFGDEDEFVADETPLSDPVTDEAEPEAAEHAAAPQVAAEPPAGEPGEPGPVEPAGAYPAGRTRDDLVDYGEPEAVGEDEEVDEFAALEADEPEDEVPPPPSGRVRSSPLPPMDWGPGLGGLTGRRRATPRRGDQENHTP